MSVYASLDSNDPSRMVIVAINKTSDAVTATINITGAPASFAKANVFVSSDWVEVKGSFTPTITGTLKAANVGVSGAPVGVDIYIDDVTITATKL